MSNILDSHATSMGTDDARHLRQAVTRATANLRAVSTSAETIARASDEETMGLWGTFVVLHTDEPLAQTFPAVEAVQKSELRDGPWTAGWQVWLCETRFGELPGDFPDQLRAATGAPALTGLVLDSSAVHVVATGVLTPPWEVWLELDKAMGYLLTPPAPFDENGSFLGDDWRDPEHEAAVEQTRREILAEAPGGVLGARAAIAWARDAGLVPDTIEAVADVLDGSETFAEDLFFRLLRRLGLNSR
jgi:hypothetical protein